MIDFALNRRIKFLKILRSLLQSSFEIRNDQSINKVDYKFSQRGIKFSRKISLAPSAWISFPRNFRLK